MPPNTEESRRAQRRDAGRGAVTFVLVQLLCAGVLLWVRGWLPGPGWLETLLLILALADLVTIPFVWVVWKQRLKEIEGGELDAARKY